MQFKNIVLALAGVAAAAAQTAAKANGAAQVVININQVTTLSKQTNDIAQRVTFTNIFSSGAQVVNNFRQIVQTVTQDIQSMASTATQNVEYTASDQQGICDAFRNFVGVHQQLLATVIGKHAFFAQTPLVAPVAAVLRAVEGGVDTLAISLINSVPTCAADATKNMNALDASLNQTITVYSS